MSKQPDILILASQPEKAANLCFLLHLANFTTLHIADDIEAFNYLVQRQSTLHEIRLLLIADADLQQPILQLLEELKRRGALLPILLVRSQGAIPIDQLTQDDEILALLSQCDPSLTHACVRELLPSSARRNVLAY